jgi:LCP family protein required for cell wall assembly
MADDPERPDRPERPTYTIYRTRPRLLSRRDGAAEGLPRLTGAPPEPGRKGWRERVTVRRVLKYLLIAVGAWLGISLLLFLLSAQIERGKVSDSARTALDDGGYPLWSASNILVLGSDLRTKGTKEPGAATSGPSRSDSIMLMRVGGGHSARLSIPRDTVVDIPGHGRDKINAAYAIGGPALAITTVKQYLGIEVNHLIEVNFANFPKFIDSLGGIDYHGGCVISKINGGFRNGGFTLRLRSGTHHLNGRQALALARTRKNLCNPREDDLTRARRQQRIVSAIKSRVTSPTTFFRLPWVSWEAPKAIRSDMAGPTLLGLFGAMAIGGSPPTRILRPSGNITLPNGGSGLVVSDSERRREVQRFLYG